MKTTVTWVALGALFIIPFLALYVPQGAFFPFITGKNFGFRILVEIAFSAWLALTLLDKRYRPEFSWTMVSYAAFAVWITIADVLAVNSHKAIWSNFERMDGLVTLLHVFAFFVVAASLLGVNKLWKAWWGTFVGASVLVCLNGLLQLMGKADIHQSADRLDATLGNAEYLAGYLLFAIFASLWLLIGVSKKGSTWLKYVLGAVVVLQTVILFQTGTRGTLIAIAVAALVGALMLFRTTGAHGKKVAAGVLAAVVILVAGLFVFRDSSYIKNSPNLDRLASVFNLKTELGTRITIWSMALEGAKEKPLHGWGQEGYNYVFNKYYEPSLYGQESWFDRAHNIFLDWLIAGGMPALLLFIALLIAAFVGAVRNTTYTWNQKTLLVSALVGYSVQGLVVFDNLFTYVPLAVLLAMIHVGTARPWKNIEKIREAHGQERGAVVLGAVVLAVGLVYSVNIPTIQASGYLIGGINPNASGMARFESFKAALEGGSFATQETNEQLAQFASSLNNVPQLTDQQKNEIATYAIQSMGAEVTRIPQDARIRLQYATLLRTLGQYNAAQQEIARAISLSPRKQALYFEAGVEALQSGNPAKAEEDFDYAYTLDKRFDDAAAYAAAGKILNGKLKEGKSLLMEHFGTTAVDHSIIIFAYYQVRDWTDLIASFKVKLAKNPDATTGFQLAAVYAQAGMFAEAKQQAQATVAAHPEAAAQGAALLSQLGVK